MKYYVYSLSNHAMRVFHSEEELIRWFAHSNSHSSWSRKKQNPLFGEVAMNWNDTKSDFCWDDDLYRYVTGKVPRTLMVFDGYDRIIDPRKFKEKILNFEFSYGSYRCRRYGRYEFRRGPVPGIHRISRRRGSYYRKVRTTQERRLAADTEILPYVRGKRSFRNLVQAWDEIPRNRDHSWKAKKIKKQWMKHLK